MLKLEDIENTSFGAPLPTITVYSPMGEEREVESHTFNHGLRL